MQPFDCIGRARVLALILGLVGASCAVQATTDHRPLTADRRPPTAGEPDAATKVKVEAAYGKLPLSFEANQGQSNEQVKFLSCGRGYTLFLTSTEAVLALHKSEPKAKGKKQRAKGKREEQEKTDLAKLETQNSQLETVVRMKLVGTNPTPQVAGLEELPGKSNYFVGNDPSKWRTNIPHYAKVKYEGIYPGIDLIYYGNQQQLEYDFVVAPGADPKTIQLAFEGLVGAHGRAPLQIDDQGDLILQTAGGELRQRKPLIYQEINGTKQAIPGRYVLLPLPAGEGRGEGKHQVGFQVAAYDTSKPLVIDPVLSYSTYLGGSNWDWGEGIAVDSSGNAYVTGLTFWLNFPTANPLQAYGGNGDAFVTKLNAAGSALVYSTFLGGSDLDQGLGIAVDFSGNAYVTGETESTDFPITTGAFQATNGGFIDAFVTKLNTEGSALVYSTSLGGSTSPGGSGGDVGEGIAVDFSGNAYVTGKTYSTDFPITTGAFQAAYGGNGDAFVTKLNAAGSALVYSTSLGGRGDDSGNGIAVDASGNAYVTGSTWSSDFPTASPFQTSNAGTIDAFVAKIEVSCLEQFVAAVQICLQSADLLPCVQDALSALRECRGAAETAAQ